MWFPWNPIKNCKPHFSKIHLDRNPCRNLWWVKNGVRNFDVFVPFPHFLFSFGKVARELIKHLPCNSPLVSLLKQPAGSLTDVDFIDGVVGKNPGGGVRFNVSGKTWLFRRRLTWRWRRRWRPVACWAGPQAHWPWLPAKYHSQNQNWFYSDLRNHLPTVLFLWQLSSHDGGRVRSKLAVPFEMLSKDDRNM